MGQGNNRGAPIGRSLSHSFFVGFAVVAAAAGQIPAQGAGRTNPHLAPRAGRKNHSRRAAGPLSTPDAQIHLAARPEGRLNDMEHVPESIRNSDLWSRVWWSWRGTAKAPE